MTVKEKVQSLLDAANEATGEADSTLTAAVAALIDGYGQGGSFDTVTLTQSIGNTAQEHTAFAAMLQTLPYNYVVFACKYLPTVNRGHVLSIWSNNEQNGVYRWASGKISGTTVNNSNYECVAGIGTEYYVIGW